MKLFILTAFLIFSFNANSAESKSSNNALLVSCVGENIVVEAAKDTSGTSLEVWYHDFLINDGTANVKQKGQVVVFQTPEASGMLTGMALSVDLNTLKGEFVAIAPKGKTIQTKVTCKKI